MSAATDPLLERFRAYCDQTLGMSRIFGEAAAASPATAAGNPFAAFNPFAASNPFAALNPLLAGAPLAAPFTSTPFGGMTGAGLAGAGLAGAGLAGAGLTHPWAAFVPGLGGAGFMPGVAPALGPTREYQEMWQRMAQLGEQVQQAQLRLLEQWNGVVTQALQQLGERASALLAATPTPETLRALYDQWVETAEAAYAQAARGADFAAAQADYGNAHSRLRSAQREYLELAAREFDLPTRAEMNTVLQQLRELKRAVREIEERLAGPGPQEP